MSGEATPQLSGGSPPGRIPPPPSCPPAPKCCGHTGPVPPIPKPVSISAQRSDFMGVRIKYRFKTHVSLTKWSMYSAQSPFGSAATYCRWSACLWVSEDLSRLRVLCTFRPGLFLDLFSARQACSRGLHTISDALPCGCLTITQHDLGHPSLYGDDISFCIIDGRHNPEDGRANSSDRKTYHSEHR